MFGSKISKGNVRNHSNRLWLSGNTSKNNHNYIRQLNFTTKGESSQGSILENFDEFNVPFKALFRKNPHFCGRKQILQELHQILQPSDAGESSSGVETVILHGMGGVGKSQIALEYAHDDQFSRSYTSIFWIDACGFSRTEASAFLVVEQLVAHYATKWRNSPDYSEIANILGIPGQINQAGNIKLSTPETAITVIHSWLGRKENLRWLLLIDNEDTAVTSNLNDLLPTCNWGSVIITSRLSNLYRHGKCIEIEGIGAEAGLELLVKNFEINPQSVDPSEIAEAKEIVATLGELPLALEQAAAYIGSQKMHFSDYRKKLKDGMKIFKRGLPDSSLTTSKNSVLTTWELSFEALSEDAQRLLCLCAFLSSEDIPEELFHRGKKAENWIIDEERFRDALENLVTLSLVKRKTSGCFWIHSLVHTWARERIDETARQFNFETALNLVGSSIVIERQERSPDNWKFERRILNHLNVCRDNTYDYMSKSHDTTEIATALRGIGFAYKELGFYNQAKLFLGHALTVNERMYGSDNLTTLKDVHNMANVINRLGEHDTALEMYQRALSGQEKKLGNNHENTLTTMHCMALVSIDLKQYDEALQLYQRTLAGREKVPESDHPDTLSTVNNMAFVLDKLGRHDEALEMYRKALDGRNKRLGSDHADTLDTMSHMATKFLHQRQHDEVHEMFGKAFVGRLNTLGSEHHNTLITMHEMAYNFCHLDRHDEALELYQKALAGQEKTLGTDHCDTLITMHHMASVCDHLGKHDQALEMYRRALEGRYKMLGHQHPHTLATVGKMISFFKHQRRWEEATQLEERFNLRLTKVNPGESKLGKKWPPKLWILDFLSYFRSFLFSRIVLKFCISIFFMWVLYAKRGQFVRQLRYLSTSWRAVPTFAGVLAISTIERSGRGR